MTTLEVGRVKRIPPRQFVRGLVTLLTLSLFGCIALRNPFPVDVAIVAIIFVSCALAWRTP